MVPTESLNFSVQFLMVLILAMALRRAYFTASLFVELIAWAETLASINPLHIFSPWSWVAKLLSCRTCITYWITATCTLIILFVVPHLPVWLTWCLAIPTIAWSINHLFDTGVTTKRVTSQAPYVQGSDPNSP